MMPSPMTKVEQLDNQMAMINSPDALRKLRGYQSMMQQPVIQREMGGVADVMPEDIPMEQPISSEEAQVTQQGAEMGAAEALEISKQVPPEMQEQYAGDVAELQEAAKGLAAMGRMGDTELVHMTAEELSGLHSMGELTYNPITGLPEAFKLGRVFRSIARAPKAIAKGVKNVVRSKAFKTLAPIVLGIAAPYALGTTGLGLIGTTAAKMSALQFGAATALGTGLGSLLAGQKPSDALKSALLSGTTAGALRGISTGNWTGSQFATKPPPTGQLGAPGMDKAASYQQYAAQQGQMIPTSSYTAGGIATTPTSSQLAAGIPGVDASNITQAAYPGGVPSGTMGVGSEGYASLAQGDKAAQLQQAISAQPKVSPIIHEQPGYFDKFSKLGSKDFYKDVGSAMRDDLLIKKPEGGLDVLKTGKKIFGAVAPTQVGEMAADMSAMAREQESLLSEEDYLNSPYKEMFPNYESYTANYYKNLKPTQYADEASAVQRFVAAEGGQPMETAASGEFSGMVPGDGGGMEDNVFMPIKKGREQVGTLAVSPTEYVVDSYTMAALGGGNPDEGAKVMDKTIEQIRKKAYGTTEQPNEIDGLRSLVPLTRSVA